MRIARVARPDGHYLARIDGDAVVPVVRESGRPSEDVLRDLLPSTSVHELRPIADTTPLAGARLLAPVRAPQKILAVGLNYRDHADEAGLPLPQRPEIFLKTPNCLAGNGNPIEIPVGVSEQVDHEAELAVVVGRRARNVDAASALDHVLGYTVANDISARDVQFGDLQFTRGKCCDTFCPLGPWIVGADEMADPQDLAVTCEVNGERRQDGTTADMVFTVAEIIAFASSFLTLEPGDVILTGTPAGVGSARVPPSYLRPGDVVTTTVAGIGTLSNPVVGRPAG